MHRFPSEPLPSAVTHKLTHTCKSRRALDLLISLRHRRAWPYLGRNGAPDKQSQIVRGVKSTFPRLVGAAVKATLSSALKCQSGAPLLGLATLRLLLTFRHLVSQYSVAKQWMFLNRGQSIVSLAADYDLNFWSAICTLTRSRSNYNFKLLFRFCEAGVKNGRRQLFAAVIRCVSAFLAIRRCLLLKLNTETVFQSYLPHRKKQISMPVRVFQGFQSYSAW